MSACGSSLARDEPGTFLFFLGLGLVVLAASVMVEVAILFDEDDTVGGK